MIFAEYIEAAFYIVAIVGILVGVVVWVFS